MEISTSTPDGTVHRPRQPAGRKRKKDQIAWAKYASKIRQLYLVEQRSLAEIREHMESGYDFPHVELRAYERAVQRLRLRRNIPSNVMEHVLKQLDSRRQQGRDSTVIWCGQVVAPEKLDRARRRQRSRRADGKATRRASLSPDELNELRLSTPEPESSINADAATRDGSPLPPARAGSSNLEAESAPVGTPSDDSTSSTEHSIDLAVHEVATSRWDVLGLGLQRPFLWNHDDSDVRNAAWDHDDLWTAFLQGNSVTKQAILLATPGLPSLF